MKPPSPLRGYGAPRRVHDIACVCRIHFARLKTEAGPFLLAAFVFPAVMYLFASAIGSSEHALDDAHRVRFLAGSIVFSVSLTAVSWLGYLLLENRFTGRLRLFATLPLAPSSYVLGIVIFAVAQAATGTVALIGLARAYGVHNRLSAPAGVIALALVILLTVLCVCGLAVIIAARARSFSEGSLLTDTIGAGMVFLAPVYYSPDALPRVLRMISRILPTTYAAHGVSTTLNGGHAVGGDAVVLFAMAATTMAIGFRVMRWRDE
jgi:ABC-2 type transport system permease protein